MSQIIYHAEYFDDAIVVTGPGGFYRRFARSSTRNRPAEFDAWRAEVTAAGALVDSYAA